MSDEKIVYRVRVGSQYFGATEKRPTWKAGEPLRSDMAAFIATDGTIRHSGETTNPGFFLRVAVAVREGQIMELTTDGVLSPVAPILYD